MDTRLRLPTRQLHTLPQLQLLLELRRRQLHRPLPIHAPSPALLHQPSHQRLANHLLQPRKRDTRRHALPARPARRVRLRPARQQLHRRAGLGDDRISSKQHSQRTWCGRLVETPKDWAVRRWGSTGETEPCMFRARGGFWERVQLH
ncbi:hypothetical protein M8818_003334 [Zalaria obscura]|uniref:Uncharacterized protein n=1 Tax=Zalaria obscura TaxID=2024903 RepID=A0ACC3SGS9_9PEZI